LTMSEGRNKRTDEAAFTDGVLKAMPSVAVPPGLEARILADFDTVAAKRAPGAVSRFMQRLRDAVWPGAPLWKPASILALSLLIGLTAGAFVPAADLTSQELTTASADTQSVLDISGDF
jgi:hypothetical protein